ncbi:helix-turn-helix domain-containing protein [Leucobacter albus]|uniref:Helix-turn-helix domain-containing protein n=1 Tax=Leucobacter albus TaxID=272210 RepID=A0ABW3TSA3_9MICO
MDTKQKILALRRWGWTYAQIAAQCGVSASYVGQVVRRDRAQKLIAAGRDRPH